jgi:hypothetical protein
MDGFNGQRGTATERKTCTGLMHAGAGTGMALVQLSVIIPGLLPSLALLAVFTAVIVAPLLALGLVAGVLIAPPYALWRRATRSGRPLHPIEPGERAMRSAARFGPIGAAVEPAGSAIDAH